MYQPLSRSGANDPATATSVGERSAVLGLLGFAFLFSVGGAIIGANRGPGAFVISAIGSFATLIGLMFAREKSPLNLVLLYTFAVFDAYGFTTQRDLRGLGGVLTVGLIAVIVAFLIGVFVQLRGLYIGISIVAALVFTGFLVYLFLALLRLFRANSRSDD